MAKFMARWNVMGLLFYMYTMRDRSVEEKKQSTETTTPVTQ